MYHITILHESDLSHLPSVEEVFHDKQIQLLLCVVLRVLVADPVHTQDLCQCRWPLWHKHACYSFSLRQFEQEVVCVHEAYFLLHSSCNVGEVVGCEVQKGLDLQSGHLFKDEAII